MNIHYNSNIIQYHKNLVLVVNIQVYYFQDFKLTCGGSGYNEDPAYSEETESKSCVVAFAPENTFTSGIVDALIELQGSDGDKIGQFPIFKMHYTLLLKKFNMYLYVIFEYRVAWVQV